MPVGDAATTLGDRGETRSSKDRLPDRDEPIGHLAGPEAIPAFAGMTGGHCAKRNEIAALLRFLKVPSD